MGEKKRRKRYFIKHNIKCIYCKEAIADSRDHVPPKGAFPDTALLDLQRAEFITVPACDDCHGTFKVQDQNFKIFLGASTTPKTPQARDLIDSTVRAVKGDMKLSRMIDSGLTVLLGDGFGGYREVTAVKFQADPTRPVIERTVRGLYHHHFGDGLKPSRELYFKFSEELLPTEIELLKIVRFNFIGGLDVFAYFGIKDRKNPQISFWVLVFYGQHVFFVWTYDPAVEAFSKDGTNTSHDQSDDTENTKKR